MVSESNKNVFEGASANEDSKNIYKKHVQSGSQRYIELGSPSKQQQQQQQQNQICQSEGANTENSMCFQCRTGHIETVSGTEFQAIEPSQLYGRCGRLATCKT